MSEQMKQAKAYADDICQGIGDRDHPMWPHLVNAYNVGKYNTLFVAREAVEWQKERSRDMTCTNGRQNKSTCESLLTRIESKMEDI